MPETHRRPTVRKESGCKHNTLPRGSAYDQVMVCHLGVTDCLLFVLILDQTL